jgi:tetratricopeptide (TPR) repeat protein
MTMPRRLVLTFFLAVAACSACEGNKDKPQRESQADVKIDGLRKLALVNPEGTGPIDQSILKLQGKVARDPKEVDGWILLGRAWVQKARQAADAGFYANAKACADIALDLRPRYNLALDLQGVVLMNSHSFREARDLMRTVLAEDPDDLMALGTISDALLELGEFDEAVKYAQHMMDLKPFLPSYVRASYIRWLQGDLPGAKEIIRRALEGGIDTRDPEPAAWATVEAAKMFFYTGDYEGADFGFDRALQAFPDFPAALAWKARVALALGRYEDAARLARKSYDGSAVAETSWILGDAERALGHADLAKEAYEKLIRLGRQGDKKTLALFFATENRDIPDALQLIEAEVKNRGDIYTHDAYAWVLYRAGKVEQAKTESDKALRLGTKDPLLMVHAGAIRVALGDKAGRDLVREALKLSPKFQLTTAREAEALLKGEGAAGPVKPAD